MWVPDPDSPYEAGTQRFMEVMTLIGQVWYDGDTRSDDFKQFLRDAQCAFDEMNLGDPHATPRTVQRYLNEALNGN